MWSNGGRNFKALTAEPQTHTRPQTQNNQNTPPHPHVGSFQKKNHQKKCLRCLRAGKKKKRKGDSPNKKIPGSYRNRVLRKLTTSTRRPQPTQNKRNTKAQTPTPQHTSHRTEIFGGRPPKHTNTHTTPQRCLPPSPTSRRPKHEQLNNTRTQ